MVIIIIYPELELDLARGHPHFQSQHWVERGERKGKESRGGKATCITQPILQPKVSIH